MKISLRIFVCFFLGINIVFFLQQYAHQKEGSSNGFNRTIYSGVLSSPLRKDLGASSYYIIGLSEGRIYLGNHARSGQLLDLPYNGSNIDTSWLNISDSIQFAWGAARIHKQANFFYLAEGVTPRVFAFPKLNTIGMPLNIGANHFDLLIPFDSFIVFRTYDPIQHRNTIARVQFSHNSLTMADFLKDQQDGVFSTDGMILYDSASSRFLYVYYYRNQLIAFDEHLKNVFHGKTIDTVSIAQITVHTVKSEQSIKFSSPPLKVNKHACTYNGLLFIYSGLRGENENGKIALKSSPIDVYQINNLKYLGSFYVPNYDGKGIRDLAVYKNRLVALRGNELAIFNLHLRSLTTSKKVN